MALVLQEARKTSKELHVKGDAQTKNRVAMKLGCKGHSQKHVLKDMVHIIVCAFSIIQCMCIQCNNNA